MAMQNLFFNVKKTLTALLLALPFLACTQTQPTDPMSGRFEQLLRRMDEQMRRGMPFDTTFGGGQLQISPDSSSYFYFHVDTSFGNFDGSDFFQFSPFGTPGPGGFFDMDSLFEQFFNGMDPLTPRRGQDYNDFPADDGDAEHAEDELLPEERLRLQQEQPEKSADPAPQPVKPEKSKVKTIRI